MIMVDPELEPEKGPTTWKMDNECDVTGHTLVVTSVAVGNVGQLACDLIVSSLSMKKVGTVHSPALIPVVGYNPYNLESKSISCSCELFVCETRKLLILLLRAPLVYKYAEQFLSDVVDKFKNGNLRDIIVLTSSFAYEKRHIMTSPFRYVANEWCPYTSQLKALEWVEHAPMTDPVKINGGGFSSMMYEVIKQKEVPCLVIYKFVSEGYNIPDAYEMCQYLNAVVPLFEEHHFYAKLIRPPSWKLMFGRPAQGNIY